MPVEVTDADGAAADSAAARGGAKHESSSLDCPGDAADGPLSQLLKFFSHVSGAVPGGGSAAAAASAASSASAAMVASVARAASSRDAVSEATLAA